MMTKVLIADDEIMIRKGLAAFPWKENGYELVGQAENGEEALLMARVLSPDIIISDIKMPVMDGLHLTQEIKKNYPSVYVILLTGFDELALVKQALHLHVDEYLLKPTDQETLLKALNKISKAIHIRKNKEAQFQKLKAQFQTALPTLRSNLFSDLVAGRYVSEEPALDTFRLFEIPVGQYIVISIAFFTGDTPPLSDCRQEVLENYMASVTISNICKETFKNYTADTLTFHSADRIHFLLIFSESITETDCMAIVQLGTHKAKKAILSELGVHLSFGISNLGHSLTEIPTLHYQATFSLNQCCFFNDDPTLYFKDVQSSENEDYYIPEARKEVFERSIRIGNREEALSYMQHLSHLFMTMKYPDMNRCKHLIIATLLQAVQITNEKSQLPSSSFDQSMAWIYQILDCQTLEELMAYAEKFLNNLISEGCKNTLSHYDGTANQIVEYIKENYASDLSLDLLSEHFHFSTTYISRLIRRSYGINFTEILSNTRLNEAKNLLQNSGMKTADIGKTVGYHDTSYFIQSFKKKYGATPNEYRNIIQI